MLSSEAEHKVRLLSPLLCRPIKPFPIHGLCISGVRSRIDCAVGQFRSRIQRELHPLSSTPLTGFVQNPFEFKSERCLHSCRAARPRDACVRCGELSWRTQILSIGLPAEGDAPLIFPHRERAPVISDFRTSIERLDVQYASCSRSAPGITPSVIPLCLRQHFQARAH
jgi:hypothetical protein